MKSYHNRSRVKNSEKSTFAMRNNDGNANVEALKQFKSDNAKILLNNLFNLRA